MPNDPIAALLIIDVQKDFCAGGALAVPHGDVVVPVLNRVIEQLHARDVPIFASRDWHPATTTHFASAGGPWPPHCVAGTDGAAFHNDLHLPPDTTILSKGQQPDEHGYSAFDGTTAEATSLRDSLRQRNVTTVYVGGLATDYCVKQSVLDALEAGLQVVVLTDAIAGVELHPGDSASALAEMTAAGARLATASAIP